MNRRSGSTLDDYLAEEGILDEVSAKAHKRLLVLQLADMQGINMNQSEQKIKDIIDKLYEQISSGWRAFQIAKLIRQAQQGQRIKSAFGFFEGVYASCLESAFLALARLIVRDARGKPLNIWYLLNCLQSDPDVLTVASRQAILSSIKEHNVQLEAIESTISNVEEQRHTTVAHLDKRHVNNPAAVYNYPPLSESEIEDAYGLLLKIIDTYTGYFQPSEDRSRLFQFWNNEIEGDIEYIVGLIDPRRTTKDRW